MAKSKQRQSTKRTTRTVKRNRRKARRARAVERVEAAVQVPTRSPFSAREQQVLEAVWEGLSSAGVAAKLGITKKTVESHKQNLYRKARVHTIAQLLRLALQEGWIDAPNRDGGAKVGDSVRKGKSAREL